jgi:hypothetical protein
MSPADTPTSIEVTHVINPDNKRLFNKLAPSSKEVHDTRRDIQMTSNDPTRRAGRIWNQI